MAAALLSVSQLPQVEETAILSLFAIFRLFLFWACDNCNLIAIIHLSSFPFSSVRLFPAGKWEWPSRNFRLFLLINFGAREQPADCTLRSICVGSP